MKKILSISAKCSDLFSATLIKGEHITGSYDGYVPNFFPGDHYGDYVMLDIDIETGKIVNWKKPAQEQLDEIFKRDEEN